MKRQSFMPIHPRDWPKHIDNKSWNQVWRFANDNYYLLRSPRNKEGMMFYVLVEINNNELTEVETWYPKKRGVDPGFTRVMKEAREIVLGKFNV